MNREIRWMGSSPPTEHQIAMLHMAKSMGLLPAGAKVAPRRDGSIAIDPCARPQARRRNPSGLSWRKQARGRYVAGPWAIDRDGGNWVLSVPAGWVFGPSSRTRTYRSLAAAKRGAAQEKLRKASRRKTAGVRKRVNATAKKKSATKKKATKKKAAKKGNPKKSRKKAPKKATRTKTTRKKKGRR